MTQLDEHGSAAKRAAEPDALTLVEGEALNPWPSIPVAGVPIACTTFVDACQFLLQRHARGIAIRLVNAWSIALAHDQATFLEALRGPGINLPDGKPVAWALRRRGNRHSRTGQVRGPSLFHEVLRRSGPDVRHFFLGGTDDSLRALEQSLAQINPELTIAGSISPPYADLTAEDLNRWAETIRASDADLVWVGLGTPKQDFATAALAPLVQRPCVGVGAAFDFLAGTQREAPRWVRRFALEWLYRLIHEPRRLWRRYLVGNFVFCWLVIRNWI